MLVDRILKRGESAEAHLMLGMAKRAAQDLAGALEELGKAVALNPELPGVHALYGRVLLETGNRDQGSGRVRSGADPQPARLRRAPLSRRAAEGGRAARRGDGAFERALGVRPGDPGVRYQMVTIYVSRGETERALPELEAIVKEAPDFLEAHVTLATVYYRLKRREDGDRERAIVETLNKEIQAKQPGAVAPTRRTRRRFGRHDPIQSHDALVVVATSLRGGANAGAHANGQTAGPPVFRTGTTAVLLDIVVRDKRGHPMRDMRQDEITVVEDGAPREVKSFRLIEGAPADGGLSTPARRRAARPAAAGHARLAGVRSPGPERAQAGAEGGAGLLEEAAADRPVGGGVLARQPAAHAAGLLAQRRRAVRGGRSRDDDGRQGRRPCHARRNPGAGQARPVRPGGRRRGPVNPATAGEPTRWRSRCAR